MKNKRNSKISIVGVNKVTIENYDKVVHIGNESIIVDYYMINGLNLKIIRMDEYVVEINGFIEQILLVKKND